jgi:hypothetical protein
MFILHSFQNQSSTIMPAELPTIIGLSSAITRVVSINHIVSKLTDNDEEQQCDQCQPAQPVHGLCPPNANDFALLAKFVFLGHSYCMGNEAEQKNWNGIRCKLLRQEKRNSCA